MYVALKSVPDWLRSLTIALLCMPAVVSAQGLIDIHPYVSGALTYDDNIFRFSSPQQAKVVLGSSAMSDVITREEAGVAVMVTPGRQKLSLDMSLNRSQFNRFSFLNNSGLDGKAAWNWQLGSRLNGELSFSRTESMAGFTEIRNPVLNMRTLDTQLARLNWEVSPGWTVDVLRRKLTQENALSLYRTLDYENVTYEAGVQYLSGLGNQLGATVSNVDIAYAQRARPSPGATISDDNNQKNLALDGVWWATAKIRLTGHLGFYHRSYEDLPQRNSSGDNKRMAVDWTPTGKIMLNAAVWQESTGLADLAGTFVNTEGWSVSPAWTVTSKILLRGDFQKDTRAYEGGAASAVQRADDSRKAGISLIYNPLPRIQAMGSWQSERRKSNQALWSYDDQTIMTNVKIDFDF